MEIFIAVIIMLQWVFFIGLTIRFFYLFLVEHNPYGIYEDDTLEFLGSFMPPLSAVIYLSWRVMDITFVSLFRHIHNHFKRMGNLHDKWY